MATQTEAETTQTSDVKRPDLQPGAQGAPATASAQRVTLRVFRGTPDGGTEQEYSVPTFPGMVVLDAIHHIQANDDSTLSCRWNCKAGKCGSCSAEINGMPRLMCKARVRDYTDGSEPIVVHPLKSFPLIKDLVTDVSWNYRVSAAISPFTPAADAPRPFVMQQMDVDRIQEYRKCIECFLCQDVCHILRDHNRKDGFYGPRQIIKLANLDMHPYDSLDRRRMIREEAGVGFCNITKCCTEVCPEHIKITDNGIIPLKERVADIYFDPLMWAARKMSGAQNKKTPAPVRAPGALDAPATAPKGPSDEEIMADLVARRSKQRQPVVKPGVQLDAVNPNRARAGLPPEELSPVASGEEAPPQ